MCVNNDIYNNNKTTNDQSINYIKLKKGTS